MAGLETDHEVEVADGVAQHSNIRILLDSIDRAVRLAVGVRGTYRSKVVVEASLSAITTFPWESYTPEFEVIVYRPDGRAFTKADLPYLVLLQVGHPAGDGTPFACLLFDGELINVTVQNGNLVVGLKGPPEKNNRVRHFSEQYGFREFVPILVERTVVAHVKLETAAVVPRGLVGSGLDLWFAMEALSRYPTTAVAAAGLAPPVNFCQRLESSADSVEERRQLNLESQQPGQWIHKHVSKKAGQRKCHGRFGAPEHEIALDSLHASIAAAHAASPAALASASTAGTTAERRIGDNIGSGDETVNHRETVTLHGVQVPTAAGIKTATFITAASSCGDDDAVAEVFTKPGTPFVLQVDLQCSDFGASVTRNPATGRVDVVIADPAEGEKWTPQAQRLQQLLRRRVQADPESASYEFSKSVDGPSAVVVPLATMDTDTIKDACLIPTSYKTGDHLSRVIYDKPSIQAALNAYKVYHTQSVDGKQMSKAFAPISSRGWSHIGHFPNPVRDSKSVDPDRPAFSCQIIQLGDGPFMARVCISSKFDQDAMPASRGQRYGITAVLRMKQPDAAAGSASTSSAAAASSSSVAASAAASPVADFIVFRSRPVRVFTESPESKARKAAKKAAKESAAVAADDDDDEGGGSDGPVGGCAVMAAPAAPSSSNAGGSKSKPSTKKNKTVTARKPGGDATPPTSAAAAAAALSGRKRGTGTRPADPPAASGTTDPPTVISSKRSKRNQQQQRDSYSPPTVITSNGGSLGSDSASDPASLPSSAVSSPSFSSSPASSAQLPDSPVTALDAFMVQEQPPPAVSQPPRLGCSPGFEASLQAMQRKADADLASMPRRMEEAYSKAGRASDLAARRSCGGPSSSPPAPAPTTTTSSSSSSAIGVDDCDPFDFDLAQTGTLLAGNSLPGFPNGLPAANRDTTSSASATSWTPLLFSFSTTST